MAESAIEIQTPRGVARAHLSRPSGAAVSTATLPAAALILGHGAGGGVNAPDIRAAAQAAGSAGLAVALVEQPYRVAGRRAPAPAAHLDEAWTAVVAALRGGEPGDVALVVGGRSMGARVACRTAGVTGAVGVLCLAFPLAPPSRVRAVAAGRPPAPSRLPELDAVAVPTLVVQGVSDPFGMPPSRPGRRVVQVAGDHGLKRDLPAVGAAVTDWLAELLAVRTPAA